MSAPMPRRDGRRRRTLGIAAVVVVLAAGAAAAVVATRPGARGDGGRSSTTTTVPPTTTTTLPPPTAIGTYKVGTTSLVAQVAGAPATSGSLTTAVWYPEAGGAAVPAAGFPLLLFSQGYAETVQAYATLLGDWASAGFVVAAPTYPHTTPAEPTELDELDIVHHPADLAAVLAALETADRAGGAPLQGLVDTAELGLVGQSDGGDVSLAAADNSCCRIAGVRALAVLSGAEYVGFGGQYFPAGVASPPLLVVQGSADTVNVAACSVQIYNGAPQPKYYLDLPGATHLVPYTQPGAAASAVAEVTTDFFDAELAHEPAALSAMASAGDVGGTAQLTATATAPTAPGACPAAP